jgi:hypothetical protein
MSRFRQVVPSDTEIDDVVSKAFDGIQEGSNVPFLSYEEGVVAALDWVFGDTDINPMEE